MFKRKIKKDDYFNFNVVIVLFIFISCFFSVGYSLLVQDLTVTGEARLASSDTSDGVSSDDLKFKYKINKWYSNNLYYYQFDMSLENISANDIKNWKISLDVPNDLVLVNSWNGNIKVKNGRLIISDNLINMGTKLTFGCQVSTSNDDFDISNIILNGEKIVIGESSDINNGNNQNNVLSINSNVVNSWQNDKSYFYQYDVVVTNNSDYNINSWKFDLELSTGSKLESSWNVNYINKDNVISFSNVGYNGSITIGNSITFGLILSSTEPYPKLNVSEIKVN